MPAQAEKVTLVDDAGVAEVFADDFAGFLLREGIFHLTFSSHRSDGSNPPRPVRVVCARLVLPISTAKELHQVLGNVLGQIEQQSAARRMPSVSKTRQ